MFLKQNVKNPYATGQSSLTDRLWLHSFLLGWISRYIFCSPWILVPRYIQEQSLSYCEWMLTDGPWSTNANRMAFARTWLWLWNRDTRVWNMLYLGFVPSSVPSDAICGAYHAQNLQSRLLTYTVLAPHTNAMANSYHFVAGVALHWRRCAMWCYVALVWEWKKYARFFCRWCLLCCLFAMLGSLSKLRALSRNVKFVNLRSLVASGIARLPIHSLLTPLCFVHSICVCWGLVWQDCNTRWFKLHFCRPALCVAFVFWKSRDFIVQTLDWDNGFQQVASVQLENQV